MTIGLQDNWHDGLPDAAPRVAIDPRLVHSRPSCVAVLSAVLSRIADDNDQIPQPYEDLTPFHALEPPAINVADYVNRVAKYAYCSNAALISAYLLMERAGAHDRRLIVSGLSCHRLFLTAVVLAAKFHDDVSYNLEYYGKVGGLPVAELAALEVLMLKTLNYGLNVTVDDFKSLESRLLSVLPNLSSNDLVTQAWNECKNSGLHPQKHAVEVESTKFQVSNHSAELIDKRLERCASCTSFVSSSASDGYGDRLNCTTSSSSSPSFHAADQDSSCQGDWDATGSPISDQSSNSRHESPANSVNPSSRCGTFVPCVATSSAQLCEVRMDG